MPIQFDTLIIFVQDINIVKPFYLEGLGFEVLEDQAPEWLLLKAGTFKIGLHRIGQQYLDAKQNAERFNNNTKLTFEIFEDIHTLRKKFIGMGIKMKEVKTFDNYDFWICDGADPEGNVFQLKEKKSASYKM